MYLKWFGLFKGCGKCGGDFFLYAKEVYNLLLTVWLWAALEIIECDLQDAGKLLAGGWMRGF